MIKRDLNAWDFVEQKPKSNRITYVGGVGQILATDNTGYVLWGEPTITDHNIIQIGYNNEGLRVDNNNLVTITDLVVTGSMEIPPQIGQMRTIMGVDGDWCIQVYHNGGWVTMRTEPSLITRESYNSISYLPKSWWGKFKNFFKKLMA